MLRNIIGYHLMDEDRTGRKGIAMRRKGSFLDASNRLTLTYLTTLTKRCFKGNVRAAGICRLPMADW
uniref:Uncharacterized protein n=1 Tax=Glossina morsitans morsitans TaxID=37546 RepID=A0A1B0FHB3_GLOMM